MEEILRIIHDKVITLEEFKSEIDRLVGPIKSDETFHKIASDVIPEDLRKGPMGYKFLKVLLGEEQANKLHLCDHSLDHMRVGEGI